MHSTRVRIHHLTTTTAAPMMVVYLPGYGSITFATPASTCDDDMLSCSLSSSSSTSKAEGDQCFRDTVAKLQPVWSSHYIMAPRRSSSCDSCDDGTLSSRENLQRGLQKTHRYCRRLYPSSVALDMKMQSFSQATEYTDAHASPLCDVKHTTPVITRPKLEEPEATLTLYISAKT